MYQTTDQNHQTPNRNKYATLTLHVSSLVPKTCRQCPPSRMASSLTSLNNKRGTFVKLSQNEEQFLYLKNASGMQSAPKKKRQRNACNLIHNITPRLSMQIHSTLELRSSQYPQPARKKARTASSHALTLVYVYCQLSTLTSEWSHQLSAIYNPVQTQSASSV